MVSLLFDLLLVGLCISHDFCGLGVGTFLSESTLISGLNDANGLDLFCSDLFHELGGLTFDISLSLLDFLNIAVVREFEQSLLVVTPQLQELLLLPVLDT